MNNIMSKRKQIELSTPSKIDCYKSDLCHFTALCDSCNSAVSALFQVVIMPFNGIAPLEPSPLSTSRRSGFKSHCFAERQLVALALTPLTMNRAMPRCEQS